MEIKEAVRIFADSVFGISESTEGIFLDEGNAGAARVVIQMKQMHAHPNRVRAIQESERALRVNAQPREVALSYVERVPEPQLPTHFLFTRENVAETPPDPSEATGQPSLGEEAAPQEEAPPAEASPEGEDAPTNGGDDEGPAAEGDAGGETATA